MSTWGILGCGTIANEMAATFQKMGHEIYGVANRTPEKAEEFADKYGVKHVFKTYEEMLADENIDIIYVATPHSMHYENMKQAVNAGKHILCEKAITVNAAQLEEVLELAEEKGVVLQYFSFLFCTPTDSTNFSSIFTSHRMCSWRISILRVIVLISFFNLYNIPGWRNSFFR